MISINLAKFCYLSLILIILYTLTPVFSIKCWLCKSDTDPKCGDPFDNNTLPLYDCQQANFLNPLINNQAKPTMCRKIRQKVNGKWTIIRGCALIGEPGEGTGNENNCLVKRGTNDIFIEYCTCNSKDGCNSAHQLMISHSIIALVAIVGVLLSTGTLTNFDTFHHW